MRRAIAVHPRGRWPEDRTADTVTLADLDRHRRRIRLVADSGAAFLLHLSRAQHFAHDDGLELDTGGYLRVCAAAEPVLEIEADDRVSLSRIAWHLGNRHLPLQVLGDHLRIRADHIAEMVSTLGGRITPLAAPFDPEFGAYAGAPHHHADHGLRLGLVGQTDAQPILAALEPVVGIAVAGALTRDPSAFGGAALGVDIASMAHETQYTRIFRS